MTLEQTLKKVALGIAGLAVIATTSSANIETNTPTFDQIRAEVEKHPGYIIRGNSENPDVYLMGENHFVAKQFTGSTKDIVTKVASLVPNFGIESAEIGRTNTLENLTEIMNELVLLEEVALGKPMYFTLKEALKEDKYSAFLMEKGINTYGLENKELLLKGMHINEAMRAISLNKKGNMSKEDTHEILRRYETHGELELPEVKTNLTQVYVFLKKEFDENADERTMTSVNEIKNLRKPLAIKYGLKHIDLFEEIFQKEGIRYATIMNTNAYNALKKQEAIFQDLTEN